MKQEAIPGTWSTPIDSTLVASSGIRYALPTIFQDSVFWIEGRPEEQGRNVIVQKKAGEKGLDILPDGFSASSKIHEYGGGAFAVDQEQVWFVNQKDQNIYRIANGQVEFFFGEDNHRYGDLDIQGRLLVCVEEELFNDTEPRARLLGIDTKTGETKFCLEGPDFLSTPRISADAKTLAWLQWDHPNMPWDSSEVWTASISPDGLNTPSRIAGGAGVSIFQPEWSQENQLFFASDATGWWSIYRFADGQTKLVLADTNSEFGLPQWTLGMRVFGLLSNTKLMAACAHQGRWRVHIKDLNDGTKQEVSLPYDSLFHLTAKHNKAVFLGGNSSTPNSVVLVESQGANLTVVAGGKRPDSSVLPFISNPTTIEFETHDGDSSYALYYKPTNGNVDSNAVPPLLVKAHSGPTGATSRLLDYRLQYWTSRGYAVLDVDYRGSTGYGRSYRKALDGNWGVIDVLDCLSATDHLVKVGDADANRLVITGSSAGGYTVLCALTFHSRYCGGASWYGVADPIALAQETHKFESRYLDSLIGPYPEEVELYKSRSPFEHHHRISSPVIFFQGAEDKIVPPSQSETMHESLCRNGIDTCYRLFEGEGHGFRKADTIKTVIDSEFAFYTHLFGLTEHVETVEIPLKTSLETD
ncbi:MAG: prolyl oligopeptidase family serine peptidase [Pseudomonadota bacterium]